MIGYKLTDQNMCTFNNTKWEIGIPKSTSGKGELCSPGWLHFYDSKLLAVLLNPIHASITNPKLFKCEATGNHLNDMGLKRGSTTLKLIKETNLPIITLNQKIAFGILCSMEVYNESTYITWAKNWLLNTDRSTRSAWSAAESAAESAAWAAESAAWAAAWAAATAWAAAAWAAESAAWAAARAAATAWAAESAARAARAAATRPTRAALNLKKIAKECLNY